MEVLIATTFVSSLFVVLLGGVYFTLEYMDRINDSNAAANRAEAVLALLLFPTEMCGYGMPKNAAKYRAAFGNIAIPPFNWAGPISILNATYSGNIRARGLCRIAYAIPTGHRILREAVAPSSGVFEIELDGTPDNLELAPSATNPSATKNCVLFGSARLHAQPLWLTRTPAVSAGGTCVLTLRRQKADASGEAVFPENDEAHLMRAMACQVLPYDTEDYPGDSALYIEDLAGAGRQPKVIGVVDARFSLDESRRVLRVLLLVRGNRRYERPLSTLPDKWPSEYIADIPNTARHYRLFVHNVSFGLLNF